MDPATLHPTAPPGRFPMLVEQTIVIRPFHIDRYGVAANVEYVRWLDELRCRILDRYYPLPTVHADGLGLAVARSEIDYRRPARDGDTVAARMWMHQMMQGKWVVRATFAIGRIDIAHARQEGYFVDQLTLRPVALPARFRESFVAELA